jgi:hypothetical protein
MAANRFTGVRIEGAKYGVGFGSALAIAISYVNNHSILWAIVRAVQFSCKLGILSTKLRSRAARHRVLRTFRPPSALIKL